MNPRLAGMPIALPWGMAPRHACSSALRVASVAALSTIAGACASPPHVAPYAMTAPEHDRAASTHAEASRREQREFDPDGAVLFPCMLLGMRGVTGNGNCWSEMKNPTQPHLASAEEHRQRAEEHRAASALLRQRAADACRDVPVEDRVPARLVTSIDAPEILRDPDDGRVVGVLLPVRVPQDVSAERLRASIDCELARRAAFGGPDGGSIIGAPRARISARVVTRPLGLGIELRSEDPATAARLVDAARATQRERPGR